MKLVTTKILQERATKRNRAVVAFNVNNMELIQAITRTAAQLNCDIILQVTSGAVKYAGMAYIRKLVDAAIVDIEATYPAYKGDIALHLDHGADFATCKDAVDSGFTSVMIDGSHFPFEENIALTKKVVEYAHAKGVAVEGELGKISGIEDHVQSATSAYTDPDQAREFVERTGVDALAISIGTAHGAFKYKPGSVPDLRFDICSAIHKLLPHTPLVLHGASSVTPADLATINKFGGKIENAMGVAEATLAKSIACGVRKINVDSDLRLAFTAGLREYFTLHPDHFDPRQYLSYARDQVARVVKTKLETFSV